MNARDDSPAKPARLTERRPRDMIISLAVLLVPIAVIFVGWRFLLGGTDVEPVDVRDSVAEARRDGLEVLQPKGLDDEWIPISHSVDGEADAVTLRLGYSSPGGAGLQLVQSEAESDEVVDAALGERPRRTGDSTAAGREWTLFRTVDGNDAYVSTQPGSTIVVIGDAEPAELEAFVSALD